MQMHKKKKYCLVSICKMNANRFNFCTMDIVRENTEYNCNTCNFLACESRDVMLQE